MSAETRLANLLKKPVFQTWRDALGEKKAEAEIAKRVTVIEGDLGSGAELPGDLTLVLHSASTVSFDPPIGDAFATNVDGVLGLYTSIAASGSNPHVVHVSTAYVGGTRKGIAQEASLTHSIDWRLENEAAKSAQERVELASRQPEVLSELLAAARARVNKVGPQAVAAATEEARVEWVNARLIEHGRLRAQSLGWTDVYTLTKAFAERIAEQQWGTEHRLSILRPSIIESSVSHPYPGWIDGFKVADPLVIAYGRGQLPEFPGVPDSVLDVIPVDHVVNAIIAVASSPAEAGTPEYYHVTSGSRNPLPLHGMFENVNEYFTNNPVPKGDGIVEAPIWRFPGGDRLDMAIGKRRKLIDRAEGAVLKLPTTTKTRGWVATLEKARRDLGSMKMLTDLYKAYVQSELIFDDRHARALHESIPEADRAELGFDIAAVDWHEYWQTIHFPAVTAMTRAFAKRPADRERTAKALPTRSDVLAVFDFEGTLVESNLVQQFVAARLGTSAPSHWPGEFVGLLRQGPRFLAAERRDRGEFIRTLARRYKGMKVEDLERLMRGRYGQSLRRRALPDALAQVAAHRAAGHRTVLVTGAMRPATLPFADLFDEIVAGELHSDNGVMSGYLATPPLVDEARGAWLAEYALAHGADLSQSYGYGDSHADVAWLQLVGHPHAVNPDTELFRHAQRKKWIVDDWRRTAARRPVRSDPAATDEKGEGSPA